MNRFTELLIEWPISAEGNLSRYTTPAVAIKQCLCRPVATPAAPPHTNRGRTKEAPNAKAMLITPGHCVEQNTPPISVGAFVRDARMLRYQLAPDCLAALVLCMGRRHVSTCCCAAGSRRRIPLEGNRSDSPCTLHPGVITAARLRVGLSVSV